MAGGPNVSTGHLPLSTWMDYQLFIYTFFLFYIYTGTVIPVVMSYSKELHVLVYQFIHPHNISVCDKQDFGELRTGAKLCNCKLSTAKKVSCPLVEQLQVRREKYHDKT